MEKNRAAAHRWKVVYWPRDTGTGRPDSLLPATKSKSLIHPIAIVSVEPINWEKRHFYTSCARSTDSISISPIKLTLPVCRKFPSHHQNRSGQRHYNHIWVRDLSKTKTSRAIAYPQEFRYNQRGYIISSFLPNPSRFRRLQLSISHRHSIPPDLKQSARQFPHPFILQFL